MRRAGSAACAVIVRGVMKNGTAHYQGWYSQEYDDAWPASTFVYSARAVPSGAAFAWLIVPSSARGACTDTADVLSVTQAAVVVRANVAGVQHTVTVPVGPS